MDWQTIFAAFAVFISIIALLQTLQNKRTDERPWFAIASIRVQPQMPADSFRLEADLKHYSGGPAINISFAVGINGQRSQFTSPEAALLPNDTLLLKSHVITGPQITPQSLIELLFRFEDASTVKYNLSQGVNIHANGAIKQLGYLPKKDRVWRNLWGVI